jgi:hypothetical protein
MNEKNTLAGTVVISNDSAMDHAVFHVSVKQRECRIHFMLVNQVQWKMRDDQVKLGTARHEHY